ncbi:hypothetical protein HDU83_007914 [Entophlyctis luteolus]|nr:hypothetical protein HDU83_007914 [Entophlyctis luteolus]
MTEFELENFVERRLAQLKASNHMKRLSVSVSSKSILERIQLYQPLDPLVNASTRNPFLVDDPKLESCPISKYNIHIWRKDISQLIASPEGLKLFQDHLYSLPTPAARYPLDLYLAIRALDATETYAEFSTASFEIFNEFIAAGAPREVAVLTFGIKSKLQNVFSAVRRPEGGAGGGGGGDRAAEQPGDASRQQAATLDRGGAMLDKLKRQHTTTNMAAAGRHTWHASAMAAAHDRSKSVTDVIVPAAAAAAAALEDMAALLPDWRLPYDVFAGVPQHLIVAMTRDLAPRFWASAEITDLVASLSAEPARAAASTVSMVPAAVTVSDGASGTAASAGDPLES